MSKLMTALFITSVTLQLHAQVQNDVPTQTEIAKKGANFYFKNLPKNMGGNLLALLGLNQFPKLEKQHAADTANPPFNMFKASAERLKPSREWSFPFYNSSHDMADVVKSEFGFCAGFSTALRKVNMMAIYDEENKEQQVVPQKRTPEWFAFYKAKIDAMMNNKMTIVPGFANTLEMSSNKEIAHYLKEVIVHQWQLTNVNLFQGLAGFLSVKKKPDLKEMQKVRNELASRISYGYNPIVYLSKYNDKLMSKEQWIHVLQIYEASPIQADGSFTLRAWDINESAQEAVKLITVDANAKIIMSEDVEITENSVRIGNYVQEKNADSLQNARETISGGNELNNILPLKWDELEIEQMIKNNKEFCAKRASIGTLKCTETALSETDLTTMPVTSPRSNPGN
ncbi:MAG: hypothetical protein H7235_10315 [Bdellovibrionaceae bacterium]|nr:hypothetical protein [Pseudobdellovibrionaceae bacterium]